MLHEGIERGQGGLLMVGGGLIRPIIGHCLPYVANACPCVSLVAGPGSMGRCPAGRRRLQGEPVFKEGLVDLAVRLGESEVRLLCASLAICRMDRIALAALLVDDLQC